MRCKHGIVFEDKQILERRIGSMEVEVMKSSKVQTSWLRKENAVVVLVVLGICSTVVLASPVPDPYSTSEQWSFSAWNYGPVTPDNGWNNQNGTPLLVVSTGSNWNESVGQHNGVWTLCGEMDFIIPNYPDTSRPEKDIWVDVIWKGAGKSSFIPDKPLLGIECDYDSVIIQRQDIFRYEDGFITTRFTLNVFPNPSTEWIVLKGDIMVDSVSISTICIPEPATFGLLIGGAFMAIRRSMKK
jgi:hypothetical protein